MTNPSSPDTDEIIKLAKECDFTVIGNSIRSGTYDETEITKELTAFYNAARSQGVIAGMEEAAGICLGFAIRSDRLSTAADCEQAIRNRIAALADKG